MTPSTPHHFVSPGHALHSSSPHSSKKDGWMPLPHAPQSRSAAAHSFPLRALPAALALTALLLAGCSSSTSKPTVTAITVMDATGAPISTTSLFTGGTLLLDATVTGDVTGLGVNWTVTCPSAVPLNMIPAGTLDLSCGFFTPGHTLSAPIPSFSTNAGYVTTYTAPAALPKGGTVTLLAHSTLLPSRTMALVLTINPAIGVVIAPSTLMVPTGGTGNLTATVTNDTANLGVDWTTSCTNAAGCGSVTPHTASGAPATYTALPNAMLAAGNTVTVIAKSTSNPAASAQAIVTTTVGQVLSGHVLAGTEAVAGANVQPFAFINGVLHPLGSASVATDRDGAFTLSPGECPAPDAEVYLLARGGDAGSGGNASLSLLGALGSCGALRGDAPVVLNEVTTTAAAWSLAGILTDATHAAPVASSAPVAAFTAADALADSSTGAVRPPSQSSAIASEPLLHTLANLLNTCTHSAGRTPGGEDPCSRLFAAASAGAARTSAPLEDTAAAALALARASGVGGVDGSALFALARGSHAFAPALSVAPGGWSLTLTRPVSPATSLLLADDRTVWLLDRSGSLSAPAHSDAPAAPLPSSFLSGRDALRDGNGRLWSVSSCGGDELCPHALALATGSEEPTGTVVDASGNLWVLQPERGRLVQFLGVGATPHGLR